MHLREALLEAANHVEVKRKRQIGMQPTDNMKFGRAFRDALPRALPDFFERVAVRALGIFVAPESAQAAMRAADIRGIDVPVDVVVAEVAVALLANMIREPTNGKQIARFVERQAILSRKALASEHFLGDRFNPLIGDVQVGVHGYRAKTGSQL